MNVLIWFKRDLRLFDHPALTRAAALGAVLPLYIVEPDLWAGADASARQWGMTAETLADLRDQLGQIGAPLVVRVGGAVEVLDRLCKRHAITRIISHQETGNGWSYARDRHVGAWARDAGIIWEELAQSGVQRGRPRAGQMGALSRAEFMRAPLLDVPQMTVIAGLEGGPIPSAKALRLADDPCPNRQIGGRRQALDLMDSFIQTRAFHYTRGLSSPLSGERACSRLSPHLALGAVSVREVVQKINRPAAFQARMAWRDHFIQKLERQPNIETHCLQASAEDLGRGTNGLDAWAKGETGLPFLDACMRYLNATGWLNFRMRAMVTSVASYHLWLDWRATGAVLARRFTDYEPGIHWPQIQMQSGTTGINRPRIYNPIKQGWDQDPKGIFTRRWLPELACVPDIYLQNPWKWDGAGRILGRIYPEPIVDVTTAAAQAKAKVWTMRAAPRAKAEAVEVIERHIGPKMARHKSSGAQLVMEF